MKNVWTDEDNQRLSGMAASGISAARASAVFGRPLTSIRNQARKLGTPFESVMAVKSRLRRIFADDRV
jgi:hypothetical protein